ncbi:MAG: FliH/SctL family protein [Thermodesulfobacteriota bacterium]|nr:FliH/SctL family protein [Thermodesulfobacteriota bacterium]
MSSNQENAFKLHYFPTIPVNYSTENTRIFNKGNKFERSHHKKGSEVVQKNISKDNTADGIKKGSIDETVREIEEKAYAKGFARGEKAGIASGEKKFESVINSINKGLYELIKIRQHICLETEQEIVKLTMAIARKIVCHEIRVNKATVANVVKEAMNKVEGNETVKVKLSIKDFQFITNKKPVILDKITNIENVVFEMDESISDGGCLIETESGDIDSRVEKQFQAVEEAFKSINKQH